MEYRSGVLDGMFLIAAGALFLANNLGMLPPGSWWTLLELWPLLLIMGGLDVMAGHVKNVPAAYALYAAEVLVLVAALWIAWTYPSAQAPEFLQYFPFIEVLKGLSEGFVII